MTLLDALTPRGLIAVEAQSVTVALCAARWDCDLLETAHHSPAIVDAVYGRHGFITAVAEVKSRELTRAKLESYHDPAGYLITHKKILEGREVARYLHVPYFVIVGLEPEHLTLYWELWRPGIDAWTMTIHTQVTRTQATVNGGSAERENAFLPLDQVRTLK